MTSMSGGKPYAAHLSTHTQLQSIRDLEIRGIDRALILVGKNNTGKTIVFGHTITPMLYGDMQTTALWQSDGKSELMVEQSLAELCTGWFLIKMALFMITKSLIRTDHGNQIFNVQKDSTIIEVTILYH